MKNVFNRDKARHCANALARQLTDFDVEGFYRLATDDIDNRELKARGEQVFVALTRYLPSDYLTALDALLATLQPVEDNQDITDLTTDENGVAGWNMLPYTQYVGELGAEHLVESMDAMRQMTKRFSSEFGIRFLFLSHPTEALHITKSWVTDPCHHVRRLASEGCRPLLPWAMQLPHFKNHPDLILPILEDLKDDSSEYVRRSVANNLNDIAKHHPDLVADVVRNWSKNASKERGRLIKHASRTLIKQGHSKTLETFGYGTPQSLKVSLNVATPAIQINDKLVLELNLVNEDKKPINVLLDFVVYHQKANGKLAPKVFKWKELSLAAGGSIELEKLHHIKRINTRKYYAGEHHVSVQINGQEFGKARFDLSM